MQWLPTTLRLPTPPLELLPPQPPPATRLTTPTVAATHKDKQPSAMLLQTPTETRQHGKTNASCAHIHWSVQHVLITMHRGKCIDQHFVGVSYAWNGGGAAPAGTCWEISSGHYDGGRDFQEGWRFDRGAVSRAAQDYYVFFTILMCL